MSLVRANRQSLGRGRVAATLTVTAFVGAVVIAACGNDPAGAPAGVSNDPPVRTAPEACSTPQAGCPCTNIGEKVPCGETVKGEGNSSFCFAGERTCEANGVYGACAGGIVRPGLSTKALGTNGPCNATLPDTLSLCSSGKNKGDVCSTNVDCGKGHKICVGTANTCNDDSDCAAGVTCGAWDGKCSGGANNNFGCNVPADCGGSPCSIPPGAPACVGYSGICDSSGPTDGQECSSSADCGGGTCTPPKFGVCIGGTKNGKKCKFAKHCKGGGACTVDLVASGLDKCDPYCNVRVDTPVGLPVASPFVINPTGGLTVTPGPPGCYGTINGTIYDPRGANPLPRVMVYLPKDPLSPVPQGLPATGQSCDTCASLVSGNPTHIAVTNHLGQFTMANVPGGVALRVVLQTGRWRKEISIPAPGVACGATVTLGTAAFGGTGANFLPTVQSTTPGATANIPKIAITTADGDQIECLLRKVGIADSQFTNGTGTGRVHLYTMNRTASSGLEFTGATGEDTLWGNATRLRTYDFVIAPCDNDADGANNTTGPTATDPGSTTATAAERTNMKQYLDDGGRLFATHWLSRAFTRIWGPMSGGGPVEEEYGSRVDADREPNAYPYAINTATPDGLLLSQWGAPAPISAVTAGTPPRISFGSWRHLSKAVNTTRGAVMLTSGDSSAAAPGFPAHTTTSSRYPGPHVNMYSFQTPWATSGAQPAACGKMVVSQSHVTPICGLLVAPDYSCNGKQFPGACGSASVAMTPQEKAFEFLLFNATACNGTEPTVTPPTPATGVTLPVTFDGTSCPAGTRPVWGLFQWQATVPGGSSIAFTAASAEEIANLPATPTGPTIVSIGTANDANAISAGPWFFDSTGSAGTPAFAPRPVSARLTAAGVTSGKYLRVFFTFNTATGAIPVLQTWRQQFSCVPSE